MEAEDWTGVMWLHAKERCERYAQAMKEACDLLAERTYGSPARSPAHNARLRLESALQK